MAKRGLNKMQHPYFSDGMKIGLFGGSFNPPHAGHALVSERLRFKLNLDLVWWLVSPQNPLKNETPADPKARIEACRKIAGHHKTYISDEETALGSTYTANTIAALKRRYPRVNFVWLMGADSMRAIHRWRNWQQIFEQVPIAVYPRPGETVRAGLGPAAACFAQSRIPHNQAAILATHNRPAWTLLEGVLSPLSSTQVRKLGAAKGSD